MNKEKIKEEAKRENQNIFFELCIRGTDEEKEILNVKARDCDHCFPLFKFLCKKGELVKPMLDILVDKTIQRTAKTILEDVEMINKDFLHDVRILKQTKNRISIISLKLCLGNWNQRIQYLKKQFGVK